MQDLLKSVKARFEKSGLAPTKESHGFGGDECFKFVFESYEEYTKAVKFLGLEVKNSDLEYWIPIRKECSIIVPKNRMESAKKALREADIEAREHPVSSNTWRRFDFKTTKDCVRAFWELGNMNKGMEVCVLISKESQSLAIAPPETAAESNDDEFPTARPFKVGERVWDDDEREFCHIAKIPGSAGVLEDEMLEDDNPVIVAYEDGRTRETYTQYLYKIVPGKTFDGLTVCYEHNKMEHNYPYFCPEADENCFENELD